MTYRILLVEDDAVIRREVAGHLAQWGYAVSSVQDFQNVIEAFQKAQPHLVLLDIMLPFYNGYYWCGEIRKQSKTPIIFISSASEKMDILMAIQMGGDDFIQKPFDLDVLTYKVQALLRRTYDFAGDTGSTLCVGEITLDLGRATLSYRQQKLELTKNELRIMQTLMQQSGHTVSRDTLMKKLWETDVFVDENTLTVNMARLRRKLATAGLPGLIKTKKGMGYLIE